MKPYSFISIVKKRRFNKANPLLRCAIPFDDVQEAGFVPSPAVTLDSDVPFERWGSNAQE
jgi:hypothetical protein